MHIFRFAVVVSALICNVFTPAHAQSADKVVKNLNEGLETLRLALGIVQEILTELPLLPILANRAEALVSNFTKTLNNDIDQITDNPIPPLWPDDTVDIVVGALKQHEDVARSFLNTFIIGLNLPNPFLNIRIESLSQQVANLAPVYQRLGQKLESRYNEITAKQKLNNGIVNIQRYLFLIHRKK
ncbi:hypothetical protein DFH27DRAFT_638888 [Peziza echinospora]|nr:hypothetical protein DFH27DRAFT_638888 [Peziza echinospora]